ncbi:Uncharacterised protein [Vibrio cholerae]|nr:Uncharacterised protein [Vibrio cholerae]
MNFYQRFWVNGFGKVIRRTWIGYSEQTLVETKLSRNAFFCRYPVNNTFHFTTIGWVFTQGFRIVRTEDCGDITLFIFFDALSFDDVSTTQTHFFA